MTRTALILGSNGRFGGAMAEALWNAGWKIRAFDRRQDDLMQAARGVDLIVNGWNPSYEHWAAELPGQTRAVIAAAEASGARILFPGNVYVYGAGSASHLRADTAQSAENPLGALRREVEAMYRASSAPLLILRAGDYIDTCMSGNWYDRIITAKMHKGHIQYPGKLDAPHAWAFLPDLARAGAMLLDTDLAHHDEVLFPGYTLSGQDMAAALSTASARNITAKPMAWWPLTLMALVVPLFKGIKEMRYLWDMPHQTDGTEFKARLPNFTPTDITSALAQTAPVRALAPSDQPRQGRGATQAPRRSQAQAT